MSGQISNNRFFTKNQKLFLFFCFVFALCIKSALLYYFALLDGDKGLQGIAALNLAHGHGYTIPEFNIATGQMVNVPLIEWPPLYSVLLIPFLWLTSFDLSASCYLLDITGALTFLIFLLLILRKLRFPIVMQALLLIYKGCELNATVIISFPTDTWATASWLAAFYFLICLTEDPNRRNWILFTIANAIPFFFRYMYLLIAFVLPLCLLWKEYRTGSLPIKKILLSMGCTLVLAGALLVYNSSTAKSAVFILPSENGFYPENLKAMAPVFWASFINTEFYTMQLSLRTGFSYQQVLQIFRWTGIPVLFYLVINYFRKYFIFPVMRTAFDKFCFYAGAISICTTLLIVLFSVIHNAYSPFNKNSYWTYIMEERYFSVAIIVVFIICCYWLFVKRDSLILLRSVLRVAFFCLFFIEVIHALYTIHKKSQLPPEHYSSYIYSDAKRKLLLDSLFHREKAKGNDIVLLSDQYGYIMHAVINNIKASRQMDILKKDTLRFSRRTLLVVAIPADRSSYYDQWLQKHDIRLTNKIDDYSIYQKYYRPE
ncbi:MAG TPA: hypothetical protein VM012_08780 [Flavitalea sp.]|nr:hypothetical protein [Flavitalea sp.]